MHYKLIERVITWNMMCIKLVVRVVYYTESLNYMVEFVVIINYNN